MLLKKINTAIIVADLALTAASMMLKGFKWYEKTHKAKNVKTKK